MMHFNAPSKSAVVFIIAAVALTLSTLVSVRTAGATPSPNSATIETRTFNDCPLSKLTTNNNYPASIQITDVMDPACVGFANLHSWSFSEDGGVTAAVFNNNSNFHFGADFMIAGPGEGEGGLRISPWYGKFVDGRFQVNATTGEIACFGGALPFYSFTVNHGITYTRGTTIHLEATYRANDLVSTDPASIQYRVIYNGNTYDSPVLLFGEQNPNECNPNGLWGMLNDGRVGGFFQPRANTGASLTGTWSNITYLNCPVANTITCPANVTQANDPNQCGAVVNYPPPTTDETCGTVTCSPASGSFFPVGTTTVTCTITPGPSCTFTVTVNDTQPPVITCPADITAVTNPICGATPCQVVNFTTTATDNCPGVTVVCSPPSGTCFPVGTTTVTCTATDASGNTATCSFTVTTFDVCLQDDSNPATVLLFNSRTGDYRFCCGGIVLTGRGTVIIKGCTISLQHNPFDRRVLALVDKAALRGNASLQFPPGTTRCTITDRNTTNNSCACALP